jgi:putative peptidoglycan lipid II flippase
MKGSVKPLRMGRIIVISTFLTFFGQILALGRESVIAAKFGASQEMDAFLLAILVPNAVLLLVQNGLLMAFIPVVGEVVANKDENQTHRVISNLINCVLAIVFAVSLLVVVGADAIVTVIAPAISVEAHALTVRMFQQLMLISLISGVVTLLTGILNIHRRYVVTAIWGVVLNGTTILGVLLLADQFSIFALVIATIGGYVVQMLLLAWSAKTLHHHQWVLDFQDPIIGKMLRLAWPTAMTIALQQIIVFADRSIGSQLGVGNVAALNFASKLVFFIPPLLIGAVSAILLPELSRETGQGNIEKSRQLAIRVLRFTLFVAVPIGVLLIVLRRPIIELAFERGEFTAAMTELTEGPMKFYAISMVAVCLREIVVRIFYAAHDTFLPLVSAAIRMILNLGLNIALVQVMGISGIALANALAICVDVVLMLFVLKRRWEMPFNVSYPLQIAVTTIALAAVASSTYYVVSGQMYTDSLLSQVLALSFAATAGGLTYLAGAFVLRVPESRELLATGLSRAKAVTVRFPGGRKDS